MTNPGDLEAILCSTFQSLVRIPSFSLLMALFLKIPRLLKKEGIYDHEIWKDLERTWDFLTFPTSFIGRKNYASDVIFICLGPSFHFWKKTLAIIIAFLDLKLSLKEVNTSIAPESLSLSLEDMLHLVYTLKRIFTYCWVIWSDAGMQCSWSCKLRDAKFESKWNSNPIQMISALEDFIGNIKPRWRKAALCCVSVLH